MAHKAWKHSSVFSMRSDLFEASKKTLDLSSDAFRPDSLSINGITHIAYKAIAENSLVEAPVTEIALKDNKSSDILKSYIGEFFSETQRMNIDSFKVPEMKKPVSMNNSLDQETSRSVASDLSIEEDIIKVESMLVNDKYDIKTLEAVHIEDDAIPALNEFSDLESEAFITVASVNNDIEHSNKVMSDKVVMAMLDEAKLVCAS